MRKLALVAFLCSTATRVTAQSKVLVAEKRITINIPTDFQSFALPTLCDDQGRSYVKLVKKGTPMDGPLFRLSNQGAVEAQFDTTGALINRYAARPDGGVIMAAMEEGKKFIDNFTPDGKRESTIQLQDPPIRFSPTQLAVFPSGEIFIAGLQYQPSYAAAAAIFDSAGHFVKQLMFDEDAKIESAIAADDAPPSEAESRHSGIVDRSVAVTGDDGLVYLMRPRSPAAVYAISSAGDVVRKLIVDAPTKTGLPDFGIRVVKKRLVIKFSRSCSASGSFSSCEGVIYSVVDVTTGKRIADYEAKGADVTGPLACYAPDAARFSIFSFAPGGPKLKLGIVEASPK